MARAPEPDGHAMEADVTEMTDAAWLWLARAAGAVAGSAISLAYMLPAGRREAGIRFGVGVASGLVFGGVAGLKLAAELGIDGTVGPFEAMLMGSASASLCAWWALGPIMRAFRPIADKRSDEND